MQPQHTKLQNQGFPQLQSAGIQSLPSEPHHARRILPYSCRHLTAWQRAACNVSTIHKIRWATSHLLALQNELQVNGNHEVLTQERSPVTLERQQVLLILVRKDCIPAGHTTCWWLLAYCFIWCNLQTYRVSLLSWDFVLKNSLQSSTVIVFSTLLLYFPIFKISSTFPCLDILGLCSLKIKPNTARFKV